MIHPLATIASRLDLRSRGNDSTRHRSVARRPATGHVAHAAFGRHLVLSNLGAGDAVRKVEDGDLLRIIRVGWHVDGSQIQNPEWASFKRSGPVY